MKTGKNLQELQAEIERRAKLKKDVVVNTSNMSMPDAETLTINTMGESKINALAHRQIAEYAGIPAIYYDKMRDKAPGLLSDNVNTWFAQNKEDRLVRMMGDDVRAFLSDKYRPLENEDLAEAIIPVLQDMDVDVMSSEITETRLYIKVVDKRVTRELLAKGGKFGDGQHNIVRCLAPSITISNSEVGKGALSVLGGVYDSFCSNLATFGERSVRKYHVGGKHEITESAIFALLSDETRRKTDEATFAQIKDVVKGAFEKSKFDSLCDKIAETQTQKIEGDVVKVVSFAAKKFGMTETERSAVQTHLIEGADLSRFGLYNAVTRTAQDLADYDRATEFERMGAGVIELGPKDWQEMARAA